MMLATYHAEIDGSKLTTITLTFGEQVSPYGPQTHPTKGARNTSHSIGPQHASQHESVTRGPWVLSTTEVAGPDHVRERVQSTMRKST